MTSAHHELSLHPFTTPPAVPGAERFPRRRHASYTTGDAAEYPIHHAVRNGDFWAASTALSNGVDVDPLVDDFTPLAIAAIDRDEAMMIQLLSHGADWQLALIQLRQRRINHQGIVDVLLRCIDATPKVQAAIERLKADFIRELKGIAHKVTAARREHGRLVLKIHGHGNSVTNVVDQIRCKSIAWSTTLDQNHEVAWKKCLGLLRNLMRGQAPSQVGEVLLLLILARSMTPQVAGRDQDSIKAELERDMSRWYGLFEDDWARSRCFNDAVKTLYSVNLAEPMLNPIVGLDEALWDLQPLARRLVSRVNRHLGQRDLGHGVGLFVAHAKCLADSSNDTIGTWEEQDGRFTNTQSQTPDPTQTSPHNGHEQRASYPRNHVAAAQFLNSSPPPATGSFPCARGARFPNQLMLLLAGVVFSIIVAFLTVIRGILHNPRVYPGPYNSTGHEAIEPIERPSITPNCPWLPLVIQRTVSLLRRYIRDGSGPCLWCSQTASSGAPSRRRAYEVQPTPLIIPNTPPHQKDGTTRQRTPATPQQPFTDTQLLSPFPARPTLSPSMGTLGDSPASTASRARSPRGGPKVTFCQLCNKNFKNTSSYGNHMRSALHGGDRFYCSEENCGRNYIRQDALMQHVREHHPWVPNVKPRRGYRSAASSMSPNSQAGHTPQDWSRAYQA